MSSNDDAQLVTIGDRQVRLRHLDRVMYPANGMTKGEVIDYVTRVAPALLHQLHHRPVTRIRFPEGLGGERFFEKNTPAGAPDWVRRMTMPAAPGAPDQGKNVTFPFLDDLPSLVWAANQGALELHTPQWRVDPDGTVRGRGVDMVGLFIFAGEYDARTGDVRMTKQYLGRHAVEYAGRGDGEGRIVGTWTVGAYHTGPFSLQPVVAFDDPIQEIVK